MYACTSAWPALGGVPAGASQGPSALVARMGGGIGMPRLVQRGGGTVTGILHHLSWGRLAGLCRQHLGSGAGVTDRILHCTPLHDADFREVRTVRGL